MNKPFPFSNDEQAIPFFERAIKEDPSYALAYVALANAHKQLGFLRTSEDSYRKGKEYAQEALEVDDLLPEAHQMMGNILIVDGDWPAAGKEFSRARELGPNLIPNMDEVHYLLWMGLRRDAVIAVDRAAAHLDPLSRDQHTSLSWRYYIVGDYDRSLKHYEKAIELGEWDKWIGMLSYQAKGLYEQAFEAALATGETHLLPEEEVEEYKKAFAETDMRGFWQLWIEKYRENSEGKPYDRAATYAFLGENDQAFSFLRQYLRLSSRIPFVADTRFDSLRDDPRFEQLLRKLNLPDDAIQRHLAAAKETP